MGHPADIAYFEEEDDIISAEELLDELYNEELEEFVFDLSDPLHVLLKELDEWTPAKGARWDYVKIARSVLSQYEDDCFDGDDW